MKKDKEVRLGFDSEGADEVVKTPRELELEAKLAEVEAKLADGKPIDAAELAKPNPAGLKILGPTTDFSKQKRYDIRIEMQDGEGKDVKIGVNGVVFQIWRGVVVSVPECVVGNLRNAVANKLVYIPNPPNPPIEEWHEQQSIPFSVIKGPY